MARSTSHGLDHFVGTQVAKCHQVILKVDHCAQRNIEILSKIGPSPLPRVWTLNSPGRELAVIPKMVMLQQVSRLELPKPNEGFS